MRSDGEYINGWNIITVPRLRVVPTISLSMKEITASARIERTPLSLRMALTRRFGSSNIDPILMSRVRRGVGGVSGAEGLTDYNQSSRRKKNLRRCSTL